MVCFLPVALCGIFSGTRSGSTNSATLSAKLPSDEALSDSCSLYANALGSALKLTLVERDPEAASPLSPDERPEDDPGEGVGGNAALMLPPGVRCGNILLTSPNELVGFPSPPTMMAGVPHKGTRRPRFAVYRMYRHSQKLSKDANDSSEGACNDQRMKD